MREDIKSTLLAKRVRSLVSEGSAVSTGSTLLNLACTDDPYCGLMMGGYYLLVGDSTSGKTWTSLTCFAEAMQNPAFKNYRLIYDDVEGGAKMDIEFYFGKEVARRMESPGPKGQSSDTVESFYYHLHNAIEKGKPFIYVLDSQDALGSKAATKKFKEQKKASEDGTQAAGSYGDGKAKYHSEHLREVLNGVRKTKSILIMISQTRDNVSGFGFEKKTRGGGKSLRFYADIEIWTSVMGKLKKLVRGNKRTVGVIALAEVRKNRITGKVGKDRAVEIPIYYGLGMDDIGSCIDFLIAQQHWPKVDKKTIKADELMFEGSRKQLIQHVEDEGMERKLRKITARVWAEIEAESGPGRKRRYE